MAPPPPEKQIVEEKIVYLNDPGQVEEGATLETQSQKELKKKGNFRISIFKDRRNSWKKRQHNDMGGGEIGVETPVSKTVVPAAAVVASSTTTTAEL